jgi:ATPase subunit of ABC transporter with duplicated ATPase domains
VESLGLALQEYNGVLLFTSHDRTFANLVATGIIEVNNGKSKRYYHGYEDYVNQLEKRLAIGQKENIIEDIKPISDYVKQKENQKLVRSLENKLNKLETERSAIYQYFLDNPLDYSTTKKEELEKIEQKILELEEEWLGLSI